MPEFLTEGDRASIVLLERDESLQGGGMKLISERNSLESAFLSFATPAPIPSSSGVVGAISDSEVSSPSIAQAQELLSSAISATSSVGIPVPGQIFVFTGNDVVSSSNVNEPTALVGQSFGVNDVSSASGVSIVDINQVHNITSDSLVSSPDVDSPVVGQVHGLVPTNVSSLSATDEPFASEDSGFSANSVSSVSEISTPTFGQTHSLTTDDIVSTSEVYAPTVVEDSGLNANDLSSVSEVSSPAQAQTHALTAGDITSSTNVSTPATAEVSGDALQTLADDIFVGSRTGVLVVPGRNDFQERASQVTPSADGGVVGSMISLDPTADTPFTPLSDLRRPTYHENSGSPFYTYDPEDGGDATNLITGSTTDVYTVAMAIRVDASETQGIIMAGPNNNQFSFIFLDGSSSTTLSNGVTGTPTIKVDGVTPTDRDHAHTITAISDWVFLLIEGLDPNWAAVRVGGYDNASFRCEFDAGPMLLVNDTLTASEIIEAETAIMAAVA